MQRCIFDLEYAICNGCGKRTRYRILAVEKTNTNCKVVSGVKERQIRNCSRIESGFEGTNE